VRDPNKGEKAKQWEIYLRRVKVKFPKGVEKKKKKTGERGNGDCWSSKPEINGGLRVGVGHIMFS